FLPPAVQQQVIASVHTNPGPAVHRGREATVNQLRKHFWFPGMFRMVSRVIRRCHICKVSKPGFAMQGDPRSTPALFPMQTIQARECATYISEHLIWDFGTPLVVRSDNGSHFTAEIVRLVADALGVEWVYGSTYRPQSQAVVERCH
ncbi:unnamed protein product, partial [Amoebophrya sp. A120]